MTVTLLFFFLFSFPSLSSLGCFIKVIFHDTVLLLQHAGRIASPRQSCQKTNWNSISYYLCSVFSQSFSAKFLQAWKLQCNFSSDQTGTLFPPPFPPGWEPLNKVNKNITCTLHNTLFCFVLYGIVSTGCKQCLPTVSVCDEDRVIMRPAQSLSSVLLWAKVRSWSLEKAELRTSQASST
jgi:hypothetical protein